MKARDVPAAWVKAALTESMKAIHARRIGSEEDMAAVLIAAVAPLIRAAERARCAAVIDCGCPERTWALAAKTSAERARACGRDPCAAIEAAAILALPDE